MEEYDNMAQMYIQQMTERHAIVLLEFQKQLRTELQGKPPKWSRELLEQRRKQHINARNKMYAEAQKLKKICDKVEERERREMEEGQALIFARREAKFRLQQQVELQALLKRIECRRKEHIKQRNLDSKRLLQRNRNVQAVLESKQSVETQRLFAEIKKHLLNNSFPTQSSGGPPVGSGSKAAKGKRTASSQRGGMGGGTHNNSVDGNVFMTTGGGEGYGGDGGMGFGSEGKDDDPSFMRNAPPNFNHLMSES